jgi:hypothetical protein
MGLAMDMARGEARRFHAGSLEAGLSGLLGGGADCVLLNWSSPYGTDVMRASSELRPWRTPHLGSPTAASSAEGDIRAEARYGERGRCVT